MTRRAISIALIALALLTTCSRTTPRVPAAPGDSTETIQVGNLQRTYYLHIPTSKQPISIIAFHGTDDPLVPFNGGTVRGGSAGGVGGEVLSATDTAARWARFDGCADRPEVIDLPDVDPGDGTRVQRETYGTCQGGSAVVLYTIAGGGHTWPGGLQYLPAALIGKTSRDIDATQLIWEFFTQHPR